MNPKTWHRLWVIAHIRFWGWLTGVFGGWAVDCEARFTEAFREAQDAGYGVDEIIGEVIDE